MQIDKQLLKAVSKGDESVIYQLYRFCYDDLYMVCRRYVVNDEDIGSMLNNAFLKIVQHISQYQTTVPFQAWIRRIAINTAIDHYRKHKKYREIISFPAEENTILNYETSVDYNEAEQQFDAGQLLDMIDLLPSMTKAVFNLYAIDGYAHKEIAGMLNISEGTSKWHLSTARKKLQEMLAVEMTQNWVATAKPDLTH